MFRLTLATAVLCVVLLQVASFEEKRDTAQYEARVVQLFIDTQVLVLDQLVNVWPECGNTKTKV